MRGPLCASLAIACAGVDPAPLQSETPELPPAPSYAERGPWPVGTREEQVVGTDGLVLTVQVWYPASVKGAATVVYDGLLAGDAYEAVPADCEEPRPMLAFSHGSGGVRYQSPFFTEFLASHGFVVVAPDHVGNTFTDASADYATLMTRRPQDVRDAVQGVWALASDAGSPYAGCLDPEAGYAVAGHSYGGYTALVLAGAEIHDPAGSGTLSLGDERVWATIAMAPWDGAGAITDGTRATTVPTLVLTGARDATTPLDQVERLWDPLRVEPRYLGVFLDAGHYSFSPVACLIESDDGCGPDFLDEATFTALVDQASMAFLGGTLGVAGALEQLPLQAPEIQWTEVP